MDNQYEKYKTVPQENNEVNPGLYVLGLFAGACTTLAFLPSVIRVYKQKSKTPISEYTLILSLVGNITWALYSLLLKDYVLTGFTATTSILFILLISSKFIFKTSTL